MEMSQFVKAMGQIRKVTGLQKDKSIRSEGLMGFHFDRPAGNVPLLKNTKEWRHGVYSHQMKNWKAKNGDKSDNLTIFQRRQPENWQNLDEIGTDFAFSLHLQVFVKKI